MALSYILETPCPGFNFENSTRNTVLDGLLSGGKSKTPSPLKTGTTIAGVVCEGGVVLGADTRATSSEVVADKMCAKIHYIAPNIYGRNPRVVMAAQIVQDMLFRYHGQIGANLILGGVDCAGGHLYTIGPYGDMDKVPYLAMGSGDLAAMAILEDGFKPNMELESAKKLVRDAIHSGIMSDLGSGNNVDICVITRQGVDYIRPYEESVYKDKRYVLKAKFKNLKISEKNSNGTVEPVYFINLSLSAWSYPPVESWYFIFVLRSVNLTLPCIISVTLYCKTESSVHLCICI
uniref:Proteasome 20S subunit beta 13a n=1 Tax=Scleropages formosus TaxID=113540 RepID=A0A8C9S0E9_SCLFO